MKKNAYFLNMILMVLSSGLCLWAMLVRTFAPSVLLMNASVWLLERCTTPRVFCTKKGAVK